MGTKLSLAIKEMKDEGGIKEAVEKKKLNKGVSPRNESNIQKQKYISCRIKVRDASK